MNTWLKRSLAAFLGVMLILSSQLTAFASGNMEAIVGQQTTIINQGQSVEDVVILGHDVTVKGTVSEILVVVNGNIYLAPSSRSDIVVNLGGRIHQAPGAKVNAMFHLSLNTPFWNGVLLGLAFAALVWVGLLGLGLAFIALFTLVNLTLRKRADDLALPVQRSFRRVALVGIFASILISGIATLCAMTIVGIPLTGLLLVLYVLVGLIGTSGVALWMGKLVLRHSPNERPDWLITMLGAGFMMALSWIPVVGFLLFCLFWITGVGTATTWLWGMWQDHKWRRKHKEFKRH